MSLNVETFSLILKDMKLRVLFLETTLKSEIKENSVENYLAIRSDDPSKKNYSENYTNKPFCLFDFYNMKVKCLYKYFFFNTLQMVKITNDLKKVNDITLEDRNFNYIIMTFAFQENVDFVAAYRNKETKCFYRTKPVENFEEMSYVFHNNCSQTFRS